MSRLLQFCALVLFCFGLVAAVFFGGSLRWLALAHILLAVSLFIISFFLRSSQPALPSQWKSQKSSKILAALFVAGILVVLNVFTARHDIFWDFSEAGIHNLSEQSQNLVKNLSQPTLLSIFQARQSNKSYRLEKLLSKYQEINPQYFQFRFVDPVEQPQVFLQSQMSNSQIAHLSYGLGSNRKELRFESISEEMLSSALLSLQSGKPKMLAFLQGHGEADAGSEAGAGLLALTEDIQRENIQVGNLLIGNLPEIPKDITALMIVAPQQTLLPNEEQILHKYVEGGGNLFVFADAQSPLQNFLKEIGVQLRSLASSKNSGQIFARDIQRHSITEKLIRSGKNSQGVVFHSVAALDVEPALLKERNYQSFPLVKADDGSVLAYALESKDKGGRVIVFASSDWITNGQRQWFANRDLALNAIHWLLGQSEGLGIRTPLVRASKEQLSSTQLLVMSLVTFLFCELLILCGYCIWWRRRNQSKLFTTPQLVRI